MIPDSGHSITHHLPLPDACLHKLEPESDVFKALQCPERIRMTSLHLCTALAHVCEVQHLAAHVTRGQAFQQEKCAHGHEQHLAYAVGVVEMNNVTLLELEDVAKRYRHPSIIDIKLGFQTWYPTADQRYIDKYKAKDASTTQAALGFKICGMQVMLVHAVT